MNEHKIVSLGAVILIASNVLMALAVSAAGHPVPEGNALRAEVSLAEATSSAGPIAAVEGKVFGKAQPIAKATVYAYEVATYALKKVATDSRGRFLFGSLPVGMYKIIAHKDGFVPSMELVMHRREGDSQHLEIEMRDEAVGDVLQGEDYWSVRSRIPPDVLRDIQRFWTRHERGSETETQIAGLSGVEGAMVAAGGFEQLGPEYGEAYRTGAELDLHGAVGQMQIGLTGSYQQLEQSAVTGDSRVPDAEARSVAVSLENRGESKLSVASSSGQLASMRDDGMKPVNLENHQLQWSSRIGQRGRSELTAQYTEEENYHRAGWVDPIEIPEASQTWHLKGSYTGKLTERTSLEAGARYRQWIGESAYVGLTGAPLASTDLLSDETLGIYGLAGSQIMPRVMVEYGLYSSVQDGSLSLMPRGGVVVDLGSDWKARTSFSRRVDSGEVNDRYQRFSAASYSDSATCHDVGEACYEVFFSRGDSDDSISVGAVHREYAETLRLYFSPDFFNRLESLFVVQGDELPELQFSMVRRIAPKILAKLESNIASGGGGVFYATDELPYENQVRYLVTSLDTRFQQTSTGVFVAFHHIEQELNPISDRAGGSLNEIEMQRLQLMLTQDLDVLADFASNWAVRFNVELSRGASPYTLTADDDLRKKLTGGISVSF